MHHFEYIEFCNDQVIYREGSDPEYVYVVLKGDLQVLKNLKKDDNLI